MKKVLYVIGCLLLLSASTVMAQDLKGFKKMAKDKLGLKGSSATAALGEEEVASGLKEALTKGVEKGVTQLSKPDGFLKDLEVKIPLPPEAQKVEKKLRQLGQGKQVDAAIESINRAAEDAVVGAKDIFVTAITSMTLTDAISILKGEKNAATTFLETSTRSALVEKFKPGVAASLEKVGATKHWNTVFSTYNKVPFVDKINPDLEEYATNKAADGLFIQIAKEELAIRENPAARVTDTLKKVFGSLK